MPSRTEWLTRIKAVEREFRVIRFAADRLGESIRVDATNLPSDLRFRDFMVASNRLEATFLIRMFAEFEAGLRQYWEIQSPTRPKMRDLLDGIAARRFISFDRLDKAHEVRKLRNGHVHGSDEVGSSLPFAECRSVLCTYFSFLPLTW